MISIETIRKEERKYHDACYDNYKLFEEGSWLSKPVKTVIDLLPLFEEKMNLHVLDLGSGIGRNSIPIAQAIKERKGKVTCIDLLDSAIDKLMLYSKEYKVDDVIETIREDIGDYTIPENKFDWIVAVSSLEHVESEAVLDNVIRQMVLGTKEDGINCIIANSEVEEIDIDSDEALETFLEVNLQTDEMIDKLEAHYDGWEVISHLVRPLEYHISRNERNILLKTNAITYVVKKDKEG